MAGRPPKRTAEEALAQGDPGKRGKKALQAKVKTQVTASGGTGPSKPTWLSKSAIEIWNRQLERAGWLKSFDSEIFADWCQLQAEIERIQRVLAETGPRRIGYFKVNENKTKSKLEEVGLLKDLRKESLKLADELGFTPSARKRLGIVIKDAPATNDNSTGTGIANARRQTGHVVAMVPPRIRS